MLRIPPTSVGIRGSSLTAIDAAVALAVANGTFIETEGKGSISIVGAELAAAAVRNDLSFQNLPEAGA